MNITFYHHGTCQCGADRKALRFDAVRVNKNSLRTTAPSIVVTAPCPNDITDDGKQCGAHGEDERGHTATIDWDRATPDDESREAIEAYRRKKGWAP